MPEPEFGNGFFWVMTCGIDFKVENGQVILDKFILDDYDEGLSGNVSFADRSSANKFKTLLKNIFSNPDNGSKLASQNGPFLAERVISIYPYRLTFLTTLNDKEKLS